MFADLRASGWLVVVMLVWVWSLWFGEVFLLCMFFGGVGTIHMYVTRFKEIPLNNFKFYVPPRCIANGHLIATRSSDNSITNYNVAQFFCQTLLGGRRMDGRRVLQRAAKCCNESPSVATSRRVLKRVAK